MEKQWEEKLEKDKCLGPHQTKFMHSLQQSNYIQYQVRTN